MSTKEASLVSVVIPVYNTASYLRESILSARNQTHTAIEIIVVDDGSNQETKEEISKLQDQIDILLTQENSGQSTARNKGIEASKGDYILILDSDDYFKADFVSKALTVLQEKPQVKFVSCYLNRFHKNTIGPLVKMEGGTLEDFLYRNASIGNGLLRKRDIVDIGGYDQEMREGYEDWELMIRLLKNGGEVFIVPEPLFMYRSSLKLTTHKAKMKRPQLFHYILTKHQEIYGGRFMTTLEFFKKEQERLTQEITRTKEQKEYRLGAAVLKPFRYIKRVLQL